MHKTSFTQKYISKAPHPLPQYLKVAVTIVDKIDKGELVEGDRLPSERSLMDSFKVTRSTIRQALQTLTTESIIEKKRGSGSYVSSTKVNRTTLRNSFTTEVEKSGRQPGAKVVLFEEKPVDQFLIYTLDLPKSSSVIHCNRLRFIDRTPVMFEKNFFPQLYFPKFSEVDFTDISVWQVMKDHGVTITRANLSIESLASTDYESEFLQIKVGTPLIVEKRISFDADNRAVEYALDYYRGDYFHFNYEIDILH